MSGQQMPANLQALLAQLQQQAQPKKPLVECKAGILTQSGTTVTADERRGKLSIIQGDDGLLHLQWKTRPQDTTELDLIVMPQSATVEKIPECTTGRVLFLKFKNSTNRRFFWLQEPKDDEDDKLVKQINDLIENPPRPGADGMGMGDDEMEQAALLSMFGAGAGAGGIAQTPGGSFPPSSFVTPPTRVARPASTTTMAPPTAPLVAAVGGPNSAPIVPTPPTPSAATVATTVTTAAAAPVPARAPASTPTPASTTATTTAKSTTTAPPPPPPPRPASATTTTTAAAPSFAATLTAMAEQLAAQQHSLENILEADRVLPELEEKDIAALLEFLPEGQRTPHDLAQTLRSPQLQQTLQHLSQILNSSQFGALMASLGLPTTGSMGVLPFCEAIQKKADDDKKKEGGDKK